MPPRRRSSDDSSPSPSSPPSPQPETAPESPEPAPPAPPSSPLFLASTRPPESPEPGTSSQPPPWSEGLDESPSSAEPGDDSGSARRSTGSPSFKVRELREGARAGVRTLGGAVHRLLTRRHTPEREVGLYLPDEEDEKAIGDPLASIASRRLPEAAKNADTIDLFRIALGLLAYLTKQAERKVEAEEARYYMAQQNPPEGDDTTTDQEVTE